MILLWLVGRLNFGFRVGEAAGILVVTRRPRGRLSRGGRVPLESRHLRANGTRDVSLFDDSRSAVPDVVARHRPPVLRGSIVHFLELCLQTPNVVQDSLNRAVRMLEVEVEVILGWQVGHVRQLRQRTRRRPFGLPAASKTA